MGRGKEVAGGGYLLAAITLTQFNFSSSCRPLAQSSHFPKRQ
jgi:hypothetical protein